MEKNDVKEAEDNSIGASMYQDKSIAEWEKLFKKDFGFTQEQIFKLVKSGVDLGRMLQGLDEDDGIDDKALFKDEQFFFNEDDDSTSAHVNESSHPEDVVTVGDLIKCLRVNAKLDDKAMFRVNKAEALLFDVHSKGGTAVIDIVPAKDARRMDEDVELSLGGKMPEEYMTMGDLVKLGKQSYPHNATGWIIDNIVGIVNGKVIDFSKIKYVRPEGYPSNGMFFLMDGTDASLDAYEKEKQVMLSEKENARSRFEHLKTMFHQAPLRKKELDELIGLAKRFNKKMAEYLIDNYDDCYLNEKEDAVNEAITYEQWQEAAEWFDDNGYDLEDDEVRQEQFSPQGDQFLFKLGKSPTGKDEVVNGTEAFKLYTQLKEGEKMKATNEGRGWYGGGYGGTGRSWKSLGGKGPRGAEIGWYAVGDLDPKAKGKMPGWRCGPSNFPFKDLFFPNRKYKVGTMVMRNKYVKAGGLSGEVYISVPSYFEIVKTKNPEGIAVLEALGIPLDLTFGMDPNDDYSVTYTI